MSREPRPGIGREPDSSRSFHPFLGAHFMRMVCGQLLEARDRRFGGRARANG
jgi:hypothetical protein